MRCSGADRTQKRPQLRRRGRSQIYGEWTDTVQSYGGKVHDQGDIEETRQIAEKMAEYDQQYAREGNGSKK